MRVIDNLIKKSSEELGISQKDAHDAIMFQFEYASKAVRGSEIEVELSGLGYLRLNKKKFFKEYERLSSMLVNMKIKYDRLESEAEKVLFKYKLDNLEEIVKDYENKLEKVKTDLEKKNKDSRRNLEQDIS